MFTEFTETELREALEHSASRADTLPDPLADAPGTSPAPRHRRVLLPAAAAALVAALTVSVVLLGRDDRSGAPVAAPPSDVASTAAPHVAGPPLADAGGIVDLARARVGGAIDYTYAGGTQTIERTLAGSRWLDVVLAPKAEVDASRIPRTDPVPIAGTTGWFSELDLPLVLTGEHDPKRDPRNTVAFRTPDGDWAFVHIELEKAQSVDDPAEIARQYERLDLDYTPGTARQVLRFGYLPAGMRVESIDVQSGAHAPGNNAISLADGARTMLIQLIPQAPGLRVIGECANAGCGSVPSRTIDGQGISIQSSGYTRTELEKVYAGLSLAPDLGDRSTWFTLAGAFTP